MIVQRFDHQFFFADHLVYHEPELTVGDIDHYDEEFLSCCDGSALVQLSQAYERQHFAAQLYDLVLVHAVDLALFCAGDLLHTGERYRVDLFSDVEEQRFDDRHGERHLQQEGGALAEFAADLDCSLQAIDHRLHDVHANAASGDLGDLFGGAKAGVENKLQRFRLAQAISFLMRDDAALDRACDDLLYVNAVAVIADLYNHLVALVIGIEAECALR